MPSNLARIGFERIQSKISPDALNRNFDKIKQLAIDLASLRTTVTNNLGGQSVIAGLVDADGTIISGTGFTVSKTGTGTYTLTWSTAFSDRPAVTPTPVQGAAYNGTTGTPTTVSCSVNIRDDSNALANNRFSFTAVGPA